MCFNHASYIYFNACLCSCLSSFFTTLDKHITGFLWNDKQPRISKVMLQRHQSQGGLSLPNFRYYYWAANIQKILYWIKHPQVSWCLNEAKSCTSSSLLALVTSRLPLSPRKHSTNPTVIATLNILAQFRKNFGFTDLSALNPIHDNHLFPPSRLDCAFSLWLKNGISNIGQLYISGVFGNSGDIFKRYNIPQSHLFRYFQVRHFARSYNSNFPYSPPDSAYEKILNTQPKAKGFISQIYQIINSLTDTNIGKIKADWEKELGMNIPHSFWKQALIRVNNSSSCARLNLIQFKVLHRLHYSNSKLSKIYSTVADSCNRCHNSPADLTHMFWSCPHLTTYWNKVLKVLADSLSLNLTPNAWMCIFGVQGDGDKTLINKHKNKISFSTLLARRRIFNGLEITPSPKLFYVAEGFGVLLKIGEN